MKGLLLPCLLGLLWTAGDFLPVRAEAPLRKVSLLTDWYPEAESGGYFDALVHGYYHQAGLDVVFAPMSPNAVVEPQVAMNKVDFGIGSSDQVMIGRARGIPLVSVMGSLQHDPVGLMVHAASPIHDFGDLEGKTVAVPPGSVWLLYVIKKYHLKDVKETALSFDYAPFLHDPNYAQQCFITSEPPMMKHVGVDVRALWVKDSGCDDYLALETSDAYMAKNPGTVRAFVAATIAGWADYLVNPQDADAEIMRRNPSMSHEQLNLSRQALIDSHLVGEGKADIGQLDPVRLERQYHILRDLKVISSDYDFKKSFTTEFLPHP